jgi:hypothetical protein
MAFTKLIKVFLAIFTPAREVCFQDGRQSTSYGQLLDQKKLNLEPARKDGHGGSRHHGHDMNGKRLLGAPACDASAQLHRRTRPTVRLQRLSDINASMAKPELPILSSRSFFDPRSASVAYLPDGHLVNHTVR